MRGLPPPIDSGSAVYISLRMVWPMRGSAVFNSAWAAVTVTLSAVAPTSSFKLNSTVLSASTTTWSCTVVRKPWAVTDSL